MRSTYDVSTATTIQGEKVCLYNANDYEHHFCHHPHIGKFNDKLFGMWSNGKNGEGEIGQRILYSVCEDGDIWSTPRVLVENMMGEKGLYTLVPAGWLVNGDTFIAYIGAFEYAFPNRKQTDGSGEWRWGVKCTNTHLYAITSIDGKTWSDPIDQHVPICPNMGPQQISHHKLLLTGNWLHAMSDNTSGLGPWQMTSFCTDPESYPNPLRDDPYAFWEVSKAMGIAGSLCEGAFIETDDGKIKMLYRSYGKQLFESISSDAGMTWSFPQKIEFSDGNSKFYLGRLPNQKFVYIGNPGPDTSRCPLVLSLSDDGEVFDKHYLLENKPTIRKYPGLFKNGMYAYPHAVVKDNNLFVIYTLWKEDVWVQKIPLSML